MDSLVAALDQYCLGIFDARYRSRQFLGLLRIGLGWLVVLGSSGKCELHAVARGRSINPFASGYRKTRQFQKLDTATRNRGIFIVTAWYFFGTFRRAHVGTCIR